MSVGVTVLGDNTISVKTTLVSISCLVETICQSSTAGGRAPQCEAAGKLSQNYEQHS
jgi:hypothetical protein